jgi:hypothetical protein
MKSSTARLKISGCSQYDECPASGISTTRPFGISASIIREIDGGVTRSAVPAILKCKQTFCWKNLHWGINLNFGTYDRMGLVPRVIFI